jgi:hypothetical protein
MFDKIMNKKRLMLIHLNASYTIEHLKCRLLKYFRFSIILKIIIMIV